MDLKKHLRGRSIMISWSTVKKVWDFFKKPSTRKRRRHETKIDHDGNADADADAQS